MALTQQETNKIKERDEQHTQELREWRNELKRRKEVGKEGAALTELCSMSCALFSTALGGRVQTGVGPKGFALRLPPSAGTPPATGQVSLSERTKQHDQPEHGWG